MTKRKCGPMSILDKENVLPNKKVRKALAPSWAANPAQLNINNSDAALFIETPVSFCFCDIHFFLLLFLLNTFIDCLSFFQSVIVHYLLLIVQYYKVIHYCCYC